MHACNLHCSFTCGGTSKQTNSHLTSAVVELNPTESPPMLRPKANLFKKRGFLSLLFLGKIPAFWRKKRGYCFFALLKTERSSLFAVFLAFFPVIHAFWANTRFFFSRKKAGKGGSGNKRKRTPTQTHTNATACKRKRTQTQMNANAKTKRTQPQLQPHTTANANAKTNAKTNAKANARIGACTHRTAHHQTPPHASPRHRARPDAPTRAPTRPHATARTH